MRSDSANPRPATLGARLSTRLYPNLRFRQSRPACADDYSHFHSGPDLLVLQQRLGELVDVVKQVQSEMKQMRSEIEELKQASNSSGRDSGGSKDRCSSGGSGNSNIQQ